MAREIAFFALLNWHEKGTFLWDTIEDFKQRESLKKSDVNFAYELACGCCRLQRLLDHLSRLVCKKLPSKQKERTLLHLALYQRYFLPNIPSYAVVHSMVELAKKFCHSRFAAFLNAILRKELPSLPQTFDNLGIAYSYPDFFVEALIKQYGHEKTQNLLKRGNEPSPMTGVLYGKEGEKLEPVVDKVLERARIRMYFADTPHPQLYIQNRTQPKLISQLSFLLKQEPLRILDMCAAPGGKTLSLHHLFPKAEIVANDIASHKIARLEENLARFSCPAVVSCQKGEEMNSEAPFDLILIDAPCSNSGVLYKCPEARSRISKESLAALALTQKRLLQNAKRLLSKGGKIWFMTCSILAHENEEAVQQACIQLGLQIDEKPFLQLPDSEGHEGGFACQISPINPSC